MRIVKALFLLLMAALAGCSGKDPAQHVDSDVDSDADTVADTDTDTGPVTTVEVGPFTPPPVRVLPLGDSITEYCYRYNLWTKLVDAEYAFDFVGSTASDPLLNGEEPTWASYDGLTLDNDQEGHAGWSSGDILTTPMSWDADRGTLYDWLVGYTPDVVLIHLGTNDAFYEYDDDVVTANLETIVEVLRAANPRVHVHLAQIIPLVYPYWNGGTYDFIVQRYNAAIAGLTARLSTSDSPVLLVDQYTGFDGEEDTFDLIHPNASGDEKVATRWFESLAADSAPVAIDDAYAFNSGPLVVTSDAGLLANDRSLVGSIRAVVVDPPSHGHLTLSSDGAFTYTYTGDGTVDAFTYVADDGTQLSAPATVSLCVGEGCVAAPPAGFFVDCTAGDDTADGLTPETAWASLDRLAAEPLGPGDAVWVVAGTTCAGTLTISGSGAEGAPITLGAWGDGVAPTITASGEAALELHDQSWVTIDGLEITGSTRWGVYVTADTLVEGITRVRLNLNDAHAASR